MEPAQMGFSLVVIHAIREFLFPLKGLAPAVESQTLIRGVGVGCSGWMDGCVDYWYRTGCTVNVAHIQSYFVSC